MSLLESQKVTVAEIAREKYATVDTLASSLNAAQEASIIADLTTWAGIRDKHLRVKGGKDGTDLDNERKREAIRQRIRKALGLSLISAEVLNLSMPALSPYAGGISLADKQSAADDSDAAPSAFSRELFEY